MEGVGLMVVMDQVVPDNQVDLEQDHRVVLAVQKFGLAERKATAAAQKVFLVVDTFSPQERKMLLVDIDIDADWKDHRVAGLKFELVMVVLADHKVVLAVSKVVPTRVVLVLMALDEGRSNRDKLEADKQPDLDR